MSKSSKSPKFGIERICVNESAEISRYLIWQWTPELGRQYYASPKWGRRRYAEYYKTEGLARADWNRIRQSFGYEFDIKKIDSGEMECGGK